MPEMWSPAIHLRDTDRVCMHFEQRESRILWDAMRRVRVNGSWWVDWKVENGRGRAEEMITRLPLDSGWITLTNEDLHLLWGALIEELPESELQQRLHDATRDMDRVDAGANSVGYRGPGWRSKRQQIQQRAGGKCELCTRQEVLDTHHRIPARRFNTFEEANRTENLIGVCKSCHGHIEPTVDLTPTREYAHG